MSDEETGTYSLSLVFCVVITVFGNSFLYGYNTGVVNNPAKVIRQFYGEILNQRNGESSDGFDSRLSSTVQNSTHFKADITCVYSNLNSTLSANISDSIQDRNYNISKARVTIPSIKVQQVNIKDITTNISPLQFTICNERLQENSTLTKNETSQLQRNNESTIEILWSITVAIFVLFGMIGAFLSDKIANKIGRKRGLISVSVLMFLAAIFGGIPVLVNSFEVIIVHRAIAGLHSGIIVSVVSLYLAEISPKKIRGSVGACHPLLITMGILFSEIIGVKSITGRKNIWPWAFAFNALPSIIFLIFIPFCPESPRYLLINKGLEAEAKTALMKLRGHSNVDKEIEEMKAEAKDLQRIEIFTIGRLISSNELRKPLFIAVTTFCIQQFSGINAVMSYSSFMYENAGVPNNVIEWVVCGTGTINVLGNLVNIPLMEKLGRRTLIIWPTLAMAIAFIVLTIFHTLQYDNSLKDWRSTFAIVSIIAMHLFVVSFAVGLGPVPFAISCEMFRQESRAAAMSIAMTVNWIANFFLVLVFRFMQKEMESYVYIPFIVVLLLSVVFIYIMVPETKNKTFDEIAISVNAQKDHRSETHAYVNEGFDSIDTKL